MEANNRRWNTRKIIYIDDSNVSIVTFGNDWIKQPGTKRGRSLPSRFFSLLVGMCGIAVKNLVPKAFFHYTKKQIDFIWGATIFVRGIWVFYKFSQQSVCA